MPNPSVAAIARVITLSFALPWLVLTSPAAAQTTAEWTPAFESEAFVGAFDRRSIRKSESYAFPASADVRRIHFMFVPKAGASYGGVQYGYVVGHADVACDRNEIVWVREEYFHFGQTEAGAVFAPPGAARKPIQPDTIDYQVGYGACTDNAITGTPASSADVLAIRSMARLMASTPPPKRTGWIVVKSDPQQVRALDMASIQPATGPYSGSGLLSAVTVTLNRGGTVEDSVRYDYVSETHLIRCQAGTSASAYRSFYNFGDVDAPVVAKRVMGAHRNLAPVSPGSAGIEALIVACNLAPATAETFGFAALLPTLRNFVGL